MMGYPSPQFAPTHPYYQPNLSYGAAYGPHYPVGPYFGHPAPYAAPYGMYPPSYGTHPFAIPPGAQGNFIGPTVLPGMRVPMNDGAALFQNAMQYVKHHLQCINEDLLPELAAIGQIMKPKDKADGK
jgi:hypothetical protein